MSWIQQRIDHLLTVAQRAMGDPVIFRPGGTPGNDLELSGINDRRFVEVNGVQSTHPITGIIVSKIFDHVGRDPDAGDQLLIGSKTFKIIEFQPDGHDNGKLILHEV